MQGFIHRDAIDFERGAKGLIEGDARVRVIGHALHFRALGGGQVPLVLHHLERNGGAQPIPLLIARQGLFLKNAGFHGGCIAGAGLLQADQSVLHIHVDLIDVLAQVQLVLAQLQHTGGVVRLGGPVAQRYVERNSRRVIGIVSAGYLGKQIAISTRATHGERRTGNLSDQAVIG